MTTDFPVTETAAPADDTLADLVVEPCDFHMIWTKNGRPPRYSHHTSESVNAEAERLARQHPGRKFIVLHATHKMRVAGDGPVSSGEPDTVIQAAESRGFKRGLAYAIGWLCRYDGSAEQLLRETGYTLAEFAQAGADEYDLEPIRAAIGRHTEEKENIGIGIVGK